jgi:5,10-methylene-tetrahydrofolate dehydrogenase/methenyl tetrahydrofolate cyclohydrolase
MTIAMLMRNTVEACRCQIDAGKTARQSSKE